MTDWEKIAPIAMFTDTDRPVRAIAYIVQKGW